MYNSGAPTTVCGVGWSLNLSYIEINLRASLNTAGQPRNQWWLTLDGAARALIADPLNAGYYRPDVDSGYTELNQNANGSWTMQDDVGNQYTFQLPSPGSGGQRYYLQSVVDVDGNTTQYAYSLEPSYDTAASSAILQSIKYNFNAADGSVFVNTVLLSYTSTSNTQLPQPNPQVEEIDGALSQHASLLTSVTIQRLSNTLKSYSLFYQKSGQTGRELLTQIKQYGTSGSPLDGGIPIDQGYVFTYSAQNDGGADSTWAGIGTAFTYDAGSGNTLSASTCQAFFGSNVPSCLTTDVAAYVDLNADGLPDMVWATPDAGVQWARNLSTPGAVSFAAPQLVPQSSLWLGTISFYQPEWRQRKATDGHERRRVAGSR